MNTLLSEINLGHKDWQLFPVRDYKEKKTFSVDELIDAYLKGRSDQADANKQLAMEKLKENLNRAQKIAEELYSFIWSKGFTCHMVNLRIKDIYKYFILFIVEEDGFCNDKFTAIYEKSIEVKKAVNTSKTFDITIIFTPQNENISLECLRSDGYIYAYGGVQK